MRHFALCMLILPSACASVLSHSVRGVHDVHSIDTAEAHAATTAAHHATMRSSDAANNATDDDEWARDGDALDLRNVPGASEGRPWSLHRHQRVIVCPTSSNPPSDR